MFAIAPLALAGSAVPVAKESVGVIREIGGFIGGLFGGRPDWFRDAAEGKLQPEPTQIWTGDTPPEYRDVTRIDPQELYAALQVAPQGVAGQAGPGGLNDPTYGTVEGLRSALIYGHKELAPHLTSLPALANAGAYTAHGTYNGDVANWSNKPAATHSAVIVGRYRKRVAAQQSGGGVASLLGSEATGGIDLPKIVIGAVVAVVIAKLL